MHINGIRIKTIIYAEMHKLKKSWYDKHETHKLKSINK